MIVVTGAPRCGTSFVMNSLRLLGLEIVGKQFDNSFGPEKFNPTGYWTLPKDELSSGVNDDRYHGKAIKLMGLHAELSNSDYFEALILCKRNRKSAIKSFYKLICEVGEYTDVIAWSIAENSYDTHMRLAEDVYKAYCGPKITLSIEDGTMTENFIKDFVSCLMQQQ